MRTLLKIGKYMRTNRRKEALNPEWKSEKSKRAVRKRTDYHVNIEFMDLPT